jgi:hypothetical protein
MIATSVPLSIMRGKTVRRTPAIPARMRLASAAAETWMRGPAA